MFASLSLSQSWHPDTIRLHVGTCRNLHYQKHAIHDQDVHRLEEEKKKKQKERKETVPDCFFPFCMCSLPTHTVFRVIILLPRHF